MKIKQNSILEGYLIVQRCFLRWCGLSLILIVWIINAFRLWCWICLSIVACGRAAGAAATVSAVILSIKMLRWGRWLGWSRTSTSCSIACTTMIVCCCGRRSSMPSSQLSNQHVSRVGISRIQLQGTLQRIARVVGMLCPQGDVGRRQSNMPLGPSIIQGDTLK